MSGDGNPGDPRKAVHVRAEAGPVAGTTPPTCTCVTRLPRASQRSWAIASTNVQLRFFSLCKRIKMDFIWRRLLISRAVRTAASERRSRDRCDGVPGSCGDISHLEFTM